jgi:hypothetical protein
LKFEISEELFETRVHNVFLSSLKDTKSAWQTEFEVSP